MKAAYSSIPQGRARENPVWGGGSQMLTHAVEKERKKERKTQMMEMIFPLCERAATESIHQLAVVQWRLTQIRICFLLSNTLYSLSVNTWWQIAVLRAHCALHLFFFSSSRRIFHNGRTIRWSQQVSGISLVSFVFNHKSNNNNIFKKRRWWRHFTAQSSFVTTKRRRSPTNPKTSH